MQTNADDSSEAEAAFRQRFGPFLIISSLFCLTIAVAAMAVTCYGFMLYPRPWLSHWSEAKVIAYSYIEYGAHAAIISQIATLVIFTIGRRISPHVKLLCLATTALNCISILLMLLTPPV